MNPLWWIPVGLVLWLLVGTAVALVVGPMIKAGTQQPEED